MNAPAGNAPAIRARVCDSLVFLCVQLEKNWRAVGGPLISADQGHLQVRGIRTDEDVIIAKAVFPRSRWHRNQPARHLRGVAS